MEQVNIYEAKTHFSKYVEKAESGEDVIIARDGKQVARLTAITPASAPFSSVYSRAKFVWQTILKVRCPQRCWQVLRGADA
jgi:prevent-host-death family protein